MVVQRSKTVAEALMAGGWKARRAAPALHAAVSYAVPRKAVSLTAFFWTSRCGRNETHNLTLSKDTSPGGHAGLPMARLGCLRLPRAPPRSTLGRRLCYFNSCHIGNADIMLAQTQTRNAGQRLKWARARYVGVVPACLPAFMLPRLAACLKVKQVAESLFACGLT